MTTLILVIRQVPVSGSQPLTATMNGQTILSKGAANNNDGTLTVTVKVGIGSLRSIKLCVKIPSKQLSVERDYNVANGSYIIIGRGPGNQFGVFQQRDNAGLEAAVRVTKPGGARKKGFTVDPRSGKKTWR